MSRVLMAGIACLVLSGCATGLPLEKYNEAAMSPEHFKICHGYSCTYKSNAGFSEVQWGEIKGIFMKNAAANPAEERLKIAAAIALMERVVGAETGTDEDIGEAVGFKTSNKQMDCIDETINTSHYLAFLQDAGLLQFYEVTQPTHRGYFIDGKWPHNTAVIKEKATQDLYVVDAFYEGNGKEPHIVPRALWLKGWSPHRLITPLAVPKAGR